MTAEDILPLPEQDTRLLALLDRGNSRTRAVLCTLARHGVALRLTQPHRADTLLQALAPWPVFKAGQFLFDLLEWEDFMTHGPAPALMSEAELRGALDLPLRWLTTMFDAPSEVPPSPLRHTASTLDLPLRWLSVTARAAYDGLVTDLTHALATGDDTAEPVETDADPAGPNEAAESAPPPLEGGFHLYTDVTLGLVQVAGPLLAGNRGVS
ncbi:hypothetical protein I2W78_19865 [Streptomyces spinoverrucosus]|uniref:hypothetical protein n=1 Tax=Streptomyces spinoverrucosus TaxID=284043 RepID=UPI0018C3ABE6|nr:hypothetical protein [Streptomyces spinoverrucosus]MBG0854041.1 hypothetical protein [Streptomyces spinoverrucosus]